MDTFAFHHKACVRPCLRNREILQIRNVSEPTIGSPLSDGILREHRVSDTSSIKVKTSFVPEYDEAGLRLHTGILKLTW